MALSNRGRILCAIATAVFAGACCDKTLPRIADFYALGWHYRLVPPTTTAANGRGVCQTIGDGSSVCVEADHSEFVISIDVNVKDERPEILFPQARFVDEEGTSHPVYFLAEGHPEPKNLNVTSNLPLHPGRTALVVAPSHKTYNIAGGCRNVYVFREQLVPRDLHFGDVAAGRRAIEQIAAANTPIRLVLPVSIAGRSKNLEFSWVVAEIQGID